MGLYGSVVPARRGSAAPPLRYEGVSRRDARGRLTLVSDTPADTSLQQRLPKFLAPWMCGYRYFKVRRWTWPLEDST